MRVSKLIITFLTWIIVSLGMIWAFRESTDIRRNRLLIGHRISLQQPNNQIFIIPSDLYNTLDSFNLFGDSVFIEEINIGLLEEILCKHPHIRDAEVFSTWEGLLKINLIQKSAIARMVSDKKMNYLDKNGDLFPLSIHASDKLPVLTGFEDSNSRLEALIFIENALKHEAFPNGVTSIHRDKNGNYTVSPEWHNHEILWGEPGFFDNKAHKANAVYAYLLQNNDIDKLSKLDLRFKGQVVYTLNN
jgi:cell division protein FtsQ|tara:strand:- start:2441 stop:3178 length:738 start_codon:yes stop_codon:yes gene_type:complete